MGGTTKASAGVRLGGRSARVREAVLRAALELLEESEVSDLTVERLAGRAGVNKTTIYRRWRDLDGLIGDVLLQLGIQRVPIPDTGDFDRDLAELAESLREAITGQAGGKVMTALAVAATRSERAAEVLRGFLRERFKKAEIIVTRAVERGELPKNIDGIAVIETLGAPFYLRLLVTADPIDVTFSQRAAAAAAAAARAGVFRDGAPLVALS
ncbi:MAG TPA: TetR/AcrR family transcriptional regulator [Candidatus Limnocylindrales bacterium]|nr:TetR/AcrR family transcriptional regulator [Candidatus Limnocylindrales bacterium]